MADTFWRCIETIHDVVYFTDQHKERFEALGLRGWWMGYFASRSAALGTPSAALVAALFHGFEPSLVAKYLPDAWELADRQAILDARLALATEIVRPAAELLGDDIAELNQRLGRLLTHVDWAGHALAAAHFTLDTPQDQVGRLWHACTALREYRGDSHVAALVFAGLGGAEANQLAVAVGLAPADRQQTVRGWSDEQWGAAADRLRQRGWLDERGDATAAGRRAREDIEGDTDRICTAGFADDARALANEVTPMLRRVANEIVNRGAVAFPNPTATQPPEGQV
jgi:hypothetical protein